MTDNTFKILAADHEEPLALFDKTAAKIGAKVIYGGVTTPEQIESMAEDADAVIVFRTHVSPAAIARMKKCKLLVRQGIGTDLIDVPAASRAGIFVSNVPDYCIEEVASHTMMLLLAAVRNLLGYDRVVREKGWGLYSSGRKVPPLDGMKLGILGLGKIGREVARKAHAFGMDIAGYDPYVHDDIFESVGVERVRHLDELLRRSRALSINTPATPETNRMIGSRELALLPPGSYLVNTARGAIVDLAALDEALASGHVAAAGVDVFEEEPLGADHPILKRDNLIVTPHVAFYSNRSLVAVLTQTMEEVVRVLRGERPLNLVNPEAFAHR